MIQDITVPYIYFPQKQLPRKMKTRLVITECTGYIFWQFFCEKHNFMYKCMYAIYIIHYTLYIIHYTYTCLYIYKHIAHIFIIHTLLTGNYPLPNIYDYHALYNKHIYATQTICIM